MGGELDRGGTLPLTDRVIAITGASSGIGAQLARSLHEAGARLLLGARRLDRLEALLDEEDTDLLKWVMGQEPVPADADADLLGIIIAYRLKTS